MFCLVKLFSRGERPAEKRMKMNNKMQKNECCHDSAKHIKGVMCDVKNCAYHNGANECYAGCICVGPHEANCSANTSCATFKPKDR